MTEVQGAPSAAGDSGKTSAPPPSADAGSQPAANQSNSSSSVVPPAPALPAKVELPGVVSEDTRDPEYIEDVPAEIRRIKAAEKAAKKATKEAKAAPAAKEAGEQPAADEQEQGEKQETETETEGTEAGEQPEAPAKYKFADVEFESQEKAEHTFRTLRGQYKGMQTRERQAAQRAQDQTVSALAWKAEAERLQALQAETDQRGGGTAQAGGEKQPAGAEEALMDSVDWELYQQLHEDHGPKVAAAWLSKQVFKATTEHLTRTIEQKWAPVEAERASAQEIDNATQVFATARTYKLQDGRPAYPELNEDTPAREIGYILGQLGLPPDIAYSPTGIHLAVVAYRDKERSRSAGKSASSTGATGANVRRTNVSAQVAAAAAAANSAASGVVAGGQPPAGSRSNGSPLSEEATLRASIRNAGNSRPGLGFSE